MTLVIPDIQAITNASNGYDMQAVSDATDWAAIQSAAAGTTYVVSGLAVTWSSGNTLAVAAGTYSIAGTLYTYAGGTVSGTNGDASDRRDIVSINTSGTVVVSAGTDCGTANWVRTSSGLPPIKPAVPSNSVLLAEAVAVASQTAYAAINLVDKRVMGIPNPLAYAEYAPSTAGSYTPVIITTGVTALDATNLKVTFTGPPSGKVQVEEQAFVVFSGTIVAATAVYFGVVSSTGSPGTLVGVNQRVYVGTTTVGADDSQMCVATQVITGLTPGTSYTWYFAAAAAATSARIIPQGGGTNTTAATGAPASIVVTAVE